MSRSDQYLELWESSLSIPLILLKSVSSRSPIAFHHCTPDPWIASSKHSDVMALLASIVELAHLSWVLRWKQAGYSSVYVTNGANRYNLDLH